MRLEDYLAVTKTGVTAFARRVGRSRQTVYYWMRGRRTPDSIAMPKIVEATKGAVMPNDFIKFDHKQEDKT